VSFPSDGSPLEAEAERPGAIVAGFLATLAIFVALIGIARTPVRIEPAAALIALVAAGMAGPSQRKLAAAAVTFVAASFFCGMAVAVLTNHPLW
jgi:hypothetical protein